MHVWEVDRPRKSIMPSTGRERTICSRGLYLALHAQEHGVGPYHCRFIVYPRAFTTIELDILAILCSFESSEARHGKCFLPRKQKSASSSPFAGEAARD